MFYCELEVECNEKKTPKVIKFYNSTKYCVDVLDQMARKHSTKSAFRRWPAQVFFNILDLAAINSWVIYKEVVGTKIKSRDYIFNLADELRNNHVLCKTSTLSDFTPGTDDGPTASSRKIKKCKINRCRYNTMSICCDSKKSVCGSCTSKMIKLSVCRNCKK
ncbi:hypothetical protein AVEN_25500-1 [Araneus ventricosus]|uniref:PiggyBac transposable element-derived protein domain-containing protein n=1 Tax=Araneus ventricosus TaxID=182803 RepID=A0A4Y2CTJ7_ARAVE|nr:hypothetical protein AVEN_25500-1 [Araneus ventricosus]